MNKIYNVAVIGCGHIAHEHAAGIYYKKNVKIKYFCDLHLERAEEFKRLYNAELITDDYMTAIRDTDVNIVIIATYPSTHLEILRQCIKYKKHVLCEKPITETIDEAEEFVRLVKDNPDVKVLVGYILRHQESFKKMAEMIQNGAIGKPIILRMTQNHHTMDWEKYLALIKSTSPIIDCGVHYFDVARWFTGSEIISVSGTGIKTEADVPDGKYNYGMVTFKMSDGSAGYYEAGWSNTIASSNVKEFSGPKGGIRFTYGNSRFTNSEEGDLIEYYKYPEGTYETINVKCERKPMDKQFDRLIGMIEHNLPASPSIDDVFESYKIAVCADDIIRSSL